MSQTQRLEQPTAFGKYELVARLAHGRMGDAYKGKSHGVEGFEKIFVVKVLNPALTQNPAFVDAVIEEAKRTVTLSHANVAQVFDLGLEEQSNQYYIAQEFVAGFDLRRVLNLCRTVRPLPMELALFVASEMAKGLDYAHRRKDYNFNSLNLLHGDLSPRNVMVSFEGEVKITDFGLARALEFIPILDEHDAVMRIRYTAPEVLRGEARSQRSDFFSLGLVLWEMLTGQHPYDAPNVDAAHAKAFAAEIPSASQYVELPRQVSQILDMLLAPDPTGRVDSASQIYEDLASYIFGNNLRADARAMSLFVRELKRHESRIEPADATSELGIPEISLSEIRALQSDSEAADRTDAEIPSHKILKAMGGASRPPLPGALEEMFLAVRGGKGKAVLIDGDFGRGRDFLADLLPEAVSWRGSTKVHAARVSTDDRFVPFGVLGDMVLRVFARGEDDANGIVKMGQLGVSEAALETFRSLRLPQHPSWASRHDKFKHLIEITERALEFATCEGPFVLVLDSLESVDQVSLEILRYVVQRIGDWPLMLVMFSRNTNQMRSIFDLGRPENLEAICVSGAPEPDITDHENLSQESSELLAMLTVAGMGMTPADLTALTGLATDRIMAVGVDLATRGLVRVPEPGVFLVGSRASEDWMMEYSSFMKTEQRAAAFARTLRQRQYRASSTRLHAALIRVLALAGDRRRMLRDAHAYAQWLENGGWLETALEFYQHAAGLVGATRVGTPQARIGFLLSRAELALSVSRLDICQASLEPIHALSEMVRSDHASVRGQLLMGQMAMQQDDLDVAHQHFRRALDAAQSLQDPDLLAFGMLANARWHHRYGDPVAGQRLVDGAVHLYERHGTYRMDLYMRALLLNRAVRLFASRGMLTRARALMADLRRMAQTTPYAVVQLRADWAEAALAIHSGDFATGRVILQSGVDAAQKHGLIALQIELLRELAACELNSKRYESAVETSDILAVLSERHGDFYSTQRALDVRATASCSLNRDVEDSLNHLQTSLVRAQEREVPKDILRCHQNLAHVFQTLKRASDASFHAAAAKRLSEQMRMRIAS